MFVTWFLFLYFYLELGYLYFRRAKKCYQKAFDLDRNDEDCGATLVDALTASGDEVSFVCHGVVYTCDFYLKGNIQY